MLFGGDVGSSTRDYFLGVEDDEVALCRLASIKIKF